MLKNPINYENFDPSSIGRKREILFGKHSGKSSLRYILGKRLPDDVLDSISDEIKKKAKSVKRSFSEDEIMDWYGTRDPRSIKKKAISLLD
jgi:homocitrate synthase NifV